MLCFLLIMMSREIYGWAVQRVSFFLKRGNQHFIRLDRITSGGLRQEIQSVRKILPIDENSSWILDSKGLYLLTNVKMALQGNDPDVSLLNFSLKLTGGESINILSVDRNNNFLVMVDKKIYLINKANKSEEISFELIGYNTTYPNDMELRFRVNDIFEDKSGVIWIAQIYCRSIEV